MPKGGARPGAGRPAGSLITATTRIPRTQEQLQRNVELLKDLVPEHVARMSAVEVLQAVMTIFFDKGMWKDAVMAAGQLAPYQSPKLSSVDLNARIENVDVEDMSLEQLSTFIRSARNDNSAEAANRLVS